MLAFFYRISLHRGSWLCLAMLALLSELTALYFQYGLGLYPCLFCIYQRVVMLVLLLSGLIGAINPRQQLVRNSALFLWLLSSCVGIYFAIVQIALYKTLRPSFAGSCTAVKGFPGWLPLDRWVPWFFSVYPIDCNEKTFYLFGFTIPELLGLLFMSLLGVALLVSYSSRTRLSLNQSHPT